MVTAADAIAQLEKASTQPHTGSSKLDQTPSFVPAFNTSTEEARPRLQAYDARLEVLQAVLGTDLNKALLSEDKHTERQSAPDLHPQHRTRRRAKETTLELPKEDMLCADITQRNDKAEQRTKDHTPPQGDATQQEGATRPAGKPHPQLAAAPHGKRSLKIGSPFNFQHREGFNDDCLLPPKRTGLNLPKSRSADDIKSDRRSRRDSTFVGKIAGRLGNRGSFIFPSRPTSWTTKPQPYVDRCCIPS